MKRRAFLQAGIGLTWGIASEAPGAADDMIAQVEHGLAGTDGPVSIQDRMAQLKVPGVSVAVVKH